MKKLSAMKASSESLKLETPGLSIVHPKIKGRPPLYMIDISVPDQIWHLRKLKASPQESLELVGKFPSLDFLTLFPNRF